jgi:anion-transporting  ArsA/GET3 family ATPase
LTRFLENRVFRLLLMPTRASLKALTIATQALLRTISKVAGSEIVEDAVAFFRAFDGMEAGFRDRARGVEELLADPGTAFVLVAAPRRDSVDEAGYFADRLAEAHQPVSALIVNRLHPDFRGAAGGAGGGSATGGSGGAGPAGRAGSGSLGAGGSDVAGSAGRAGSSAPGGGGSGDASTEAPGGGGSGDASTEAPAAMSGEIGDIGREEAAGALAGMRQNLADLQLVADRERDYLETLESRIEGAVVKVPYLPKDVHDLEGLGLVAACLTGQVLSERG